MTPVMQMALIGLIWAVSTCLVVATFTACARWLLEGIFWETMGGNPRGDAPDPVFPIRQDEHRQEEQPND